MATGDDIDDPDADRDISERDDDRGERPAPVRAESGSAADTSRSTRGGVPGWALVLAAAAGLVVGAGATYAIVDRDDGEGDDCEASIEVVNDAIERIDTINESEVQNSTFFAALIVEQRTITYAMEDASSCFSLLDRAAAAGLLDGLQGLLAAGVSAQAPPASPAETEVPVPDVDTEPVEPAGEE